MTFKAESQWKVVKDILHADADDSTVIIDTQRGVFFEVSELAAKVWQRLTQGSATLDELAEEIKQGCSISHHELLTQLSKLLMTLHQEQLVESPTLGPAQSDPLRPETAHSAAFGVLGKLHKFTHLKGVPFAY